MRLQMVDIGQLLSEDDHRIGAAHLEPLKLQPELLA